MRQSDWKFTAVVVGSELIAIELGDTTARMYGISFDIGTTTVVGTLVDLKTGASLAVHSTLNAQAVFGADVIARISHAMMNESGLEQLQEKIIGSINGLITKLLEEAQVSGQEIYELVIAGNTTMHHLILGLEPEAIGVMPFIPVVEEETSFYASELGLGVLPQAPVHFLPHLGAYVGADLVAGILATGLARAEGIRLLVDVGTNGEIILGSKERTIATAAPAGPAFEGAQIRDGMRASNGAIEAVTITNEGVNLQVIGDMLPLGLCGSGLIDAVAQLLLCGILTSSGRFIREAQAQKRFPEQLANRLVTLEGDLRAFVLAWPEESEYGKQIVLTQRDIRELQFAKGSIAGGIEVVMNELGIGLDDLEEIYLAGSFGNYINPQSARIIGLVPPVPVEKIKAVGNASGEGAKIALLSFRERQIAQALPDIVEYHELSGRADFNDSFIEVLQFPVLTEKDLVSGD